MKDIYNAEDIDKAQLAVKAFDIDYGKKYPKAVAKSSTISTCCSSSSNTRPSIGFTYAPRTRSNPPSPQCD